MKARKPTPLQIVSPLHKAQRQMSIHLNAAARTHGIEGTEGHLLSFVSVYGPVRIAELRRVFGHQPSTLTSMLDRLEHAGLLKREINPADRRSFLIRATRKGASVGRKARKLVEQFEAELMAEIDPRDLAGFQRVLRVLGDITHVQLRKD